MASKFTITAELNLQTKNLSQVVNNLKQQFQGADLNIKIKDLAKAEASLRNISTGAKDASASMGTLGASISQGIRRFTVVTAVTGTIVGFTRALKNAVSDAIEFERELVKIAQATGQSVAQLRGLATEVGNVSSSFGVSSKELILAARSLTQAGFAADKVTGSLKILAQTELAATFDSISNTTEGAIALLNQFGKQAQKTGSEVAFLEKSFSAINQVSKEFAVESSDLVTAVRTTGAAFEAAGGNLNELLALFTSVRSTTRESAESISTGFRTIFTRIQRVDTINNLKALGIQLQDVEGKFVGPMEATKRLSMALSTIDPRDFRFNLIVEELGGFRQVSKVIPLIQQFATTQKALNVAQGSSGSLAKDAQTAQLSLAVQISKTREEFLRFIRDLTETESFQGTVRTLLNMANAFIKVADTIKPLIPLLGVFAGLRIGQSILPAIASVAGGRNRKAEGGVIHKFARGGLVPGEGNGDTVPAMLTPGEFVIRKSSVKKLGVDNLARANKYGRGGAVQFYEDPAGQVKENDLAKQKNTKLRPSMKTHFTHLDMLRGSKSGNIAQYYSSFGIDLPANWNIDWSQPANKRGITQENLQSYVKSKGKNIFQTMLNQRQSAKTKKTIKTAYGITDFDQLQALDNNATKIVEKFVSLLDNGKGKFLDTDIDVITKQIPRKFTEAVKSIKDVNLLPSFNRVVSKRLKDTTTRKKLSPEEYQEFNNPAKGRSSRNLTQTQQQMKATFERRKKFWENHKLKKDQEVENFALGGPAGKSRAARAITIPRLNSYTFDKPAGADLDSVNSDKQAYKLNAEDRLDYDVNNVNVDVSKLKVSKDLLEQYNTADDQKRGYRFEDILKETGMAKSLSQVSNARLDGITAAGDPFEAKSRKSAIGISELEDKLYGAISDNISDPEKLARARFNANDLTEKEDHIKIGKVTVFEDVTRGLGAAVNTKARMGYAEEEAAKQAKEQNKMASVNAQQTLQDLVKNNFGSGFIIQGKQYSPVTKADKVHPDVPMNLNQLLGGKYQDTIGLNGGPAKVLELLKTFIVRNPVQNKASGGSIASLAWLASGGAASGTDTVPAMLTPGEYVINKKSAQAIGYSNLNRMNKVGKFANGGEVQYLSKGGVAGNNNSEFSDIFSKYNDDELHHIFVKTALLSPNFSDSLTQYRELNLLPKPDSSQRGNSLKTMIEGYGLSKLSDKQLEAKYKNQFEITDDIKNAFKYYDRGIVDLISSFKKEDKTKIGEMTNVDLKKDKNFGKIEVHTGKNAISARYIGDENDRTGFITAVKAKGDDDFYRTKFSYATSGYGLKLYETLLSEVAKAGSWMAPDNADISNEAANLWKRYYTRSDVDKNLLSYSNWNNKTGKFKTTPAKDIEQLKSTWPSKKDTDWALQYKYRKLAASADDANIVRSKRNFGPSYEGQEAVISAFYETPTRLAVGGNVPGDGNQDTVPAMLTPGEYVINKKSAQAIGYGALNRMNKVGKFANGGPVQFLNPGGGVGTNFNFTADTVNTTPKTIPQAAKPEEEVQKVTNKFGDLSDQLLLFGPTITGAISQMGMFEKSTADMISATTFTFSTIKGVGGNLTQQVGKYFDLKEDSKSFKMLNTAVTAYALTQTAAAARVQYFGNTVEAEGKKFASFVESLSNSPGVSKDAMTQALTEQFKAASQVQIRQGGIVKAAGVVGTAAGMLGGGYFGSVPGAMAGGAAGGAAAEELAAYAVYGARLKKVTEQANALSSAMYSATESNREFQKFFQNIDKESPEKIAQQSAKLAAAYKLQSDELSKFNSNDLANASDSVKQQFQAVSEAAKLTAKNLQSIIGTQLQQAVKRSGQLVSEGYMPDNEKILQPTLDSIRSKNESDYAKPIANARTQEERKGLEAKRDTQIAIEQNEARKAMAEATKQQLEMTKALVLENNIRKDLIGSIQKQLAISAGIERTAYELARVSQTVSNIDAVFSGSLTGLKSSYDPEALKMKSPDQGRLDDALAPVREIGPVGKDLSDNILNINKVMPNLEAKLLEFSKATDTASGGLFDVASFVKTAFNIDPNGLVGKTLVNIIEGTTRGTSGTNSVTAATTSLRNEDVRKRIVDTFEKFGESFRTQASGIIQNLAQAEQEGKVIAEKINESRQKQLDLALQGVDTFSQYVEAISKARGRDMTLMEKNTIRNMRQYSLAGSMGNNSAALGTRLNKIYADLNKGGLSTEESANLNLEAKKLTKALEGLANQSDKTADILQEIDKVKKNRENLRELGREFGTGTAEDKDKMQQDMAAAMTVAQTGTYDSIPEEMRKGADAMLERFKDIPAFKQAQNRAIANTFMQAGNPLAAQMVLQETSTPEQILINELNILFNQQIMAQQTLSAIEGQRQEFLRQAQVENTNVIKQMTILIEQLIAQFQAEADAKAKPEVSSGPKSLTDVQGEKNSLANPNATAIGSTGIGNGNFVFNASANAMGRRDLTMPEDAKVKIDTESMSSLNENIGYMDTNVLAIDATIGELNLYFTALKDNLVLLNAIFEKEKRKNEAPPVEIRTSETGGGTINMTPRMNGGLIYRADGGSIFQPKGTDTVPAMLTPGEFVIKKSSVDKIGADTLSKINAGAYATGGLVSYLAEGGEAIAQGGAKINNITLKRVYDQLQTIDKRVAFLEKEYKALAVLIYSGALGGGQQMAQQGGGQQMAQQGGGQQQMANQPQGNGLRSVPPAREPIKLDDKGKPSPDGKRVLTPIPPEPNNNFRNDLYKDSDGKVVSQNGMPVADWEVKGWRLQANVQQAKDYQKLSTPMTSAGRRSAKKNMRERDLQHEDDIVKAVRDGKATPEQRLEYDERYERKLIADQKKYGEEDTSTLLNPMGGRKSYIERREEAEGISENRRAEEKADPARFKRPSATATWDPVKRIWNDSVAQAEKATMDDPNALESRLLGLTGHKPIKPEDRPAAEARLKALQDQKEAERVAKLNNEQIAREANAELDLAIKKKAPIAQLLPLYDKAEKADAAVRAEREAQSKADAEKRKTAEEESKAKEEKKEPFGTYEDPQTGKRVRDVEFDPILAGTGPQLPFEVEKARRAAAIEEKNKKDVQDGGRRAFNTLLTGSSVQPSNEDIANKVKTSLKGFQEKNIATTTKRKIEEAAAAEKASAEIGPKIPIEIKQQRDVIEENRRKQAELLNYKPKSKTDALPMKSNKPPQFLRDAKGNQNAAEARGLAAMRGDLSGTPGKILGGPGAGILQGLAGIGGLPPLLADTVAGTDFTPKYQNFVEKNVPNQTGTVGEVAKFAGTALAATVTSGASALGSAPTFAKAIPPLIKGAASTGVGELTGRTLDALGVNPLAQAGLALLTSVGTNRIMGARGKVADSTPDSTPSVAPPVAPVWLDELYDEMFGQAKRPPAKRPPVSKADDAYNATMPKGTTRDEVLRDFRAGDVESPTTPLNTADDILKAIRSPDTVSMADHNTLVNARNQQMAKAPQLQNLGESSKSTSSNPVTPQPYQVDTTQVNMSQADAQTKAAVKAATAQEASTAPVTETYVNPTAVTSKVETPPSKPRGVLGRLSNIFNLDNSAIPNKSTFRAGQPIDTAKATTIPTTSPADNILKAVKDNPTAPYDRSKLVVTDLTNPRSPFSSSFQTAAENLTIPKGTTRDELVRDFRAGDVPTIKEEVLPPPTKKQQEDYQAKIAGPAKEKELAEAQKKASGGLITYLANGGPFYGMPRSGGAFNNFGNAMAGSLNDTSNWMTKSYNDYAYAPSQAFNDTGNWMTGSFNDAASGMTGSFNDAASGMTNSFNNMANFMSGSFQGAGNWMTGSFNDAASGMTNSFNNFAASFEKGGLISYLARGGSPKGTDTVPAMLTPGEFVMKKAAVDKHGTDFMEQLNNGGEVPGFATGGLVDYFGRGGRARARRARARSRQQRGGGLMSVPPSPTGMATPPAVAAPIPPQQEAATTATAATATTPPPETAPTPPAVAAPVPPQQAAATAATAAAATATPPPETAATPPAVPPQQAAAVATTTPTGLLQRAKDGLWNVGVSASENDVLGPIGRAASGLGTGIGKAILNSVGTEQPELGPTEEIYTKEYGRVLARKYLSGPKSEAGLYQIQETVPPQQEAATTATAATATTPPVKKFNVLTPPPIPPQQEAATTATAAAATATPPPETAATPPAPLQPRSIPAEYAYGDSRDEKLANLEAKHDADLNTAIKNNESMEFIAQLESKFREEKFAIQREGSGGLKKTKGTGIDIDAEGNELPFGTLANQEIMARITPERHAQFAAETAAKHKKWTDERTVKEKERKARELLSDAEFDKKQAAEDAKNYYPNMRQAALDTLKIAGTVGTVATLGTLALGAGGVGMGSAGIAALGGSAYGAGTVVAGAGLVGVAGGLAHQQKRQNEEEADRKSKGYATGGLISYLANGGSPKGSDTVPAMLTPGEFVMKKEAVDKHGTDFMEKLNKGGEVPGFATGGLVNYFRNGGRSGSIAEARARQFNDPRNAGRLEHVARMQTAATGSSYIAQAGAAFAPQRYGNMGGGGQMEMQQGGGQMQVQQGGPAENKQQANGGGLRSVAPSPTGGDSGSTGGGTGAPNMSEVTTALNNMSTAFTGFTDKLNALATAFSGLTITHNIVFGGQINVGGVNGPAIVAALQGYVNQVVSAAIAAAPAKPVIQTGGVPKTASPPG